MFEIFGMIAGAIALVALGAYEFRRRDKKAEEAAAHDRAEIHHRYGGGG